MAIKKNWFYFLSVSLTVAGVLYLFVYGFLTVGAERKHGFMVQGGFLLGLFGLWVLICLLAVLSGKGTPADSFFEERGKTKWGEAVIVSGLLLLAAAVRIWVIREIPGAYLKEYKEYYEIAKALRDGSIQGYGGTYCDYIAQVPAVMGYSYLLTIAFRLFGAGVRAGQYMNIFFSLASAFLSYKIAKKLGGRAAGITALILSGFWPSQIFSAAILTPGQAFLFFSLLCIWLFFSLLLDYDKETEDALEAVLLYFLLGALLAVNAAINAAAVILLVVMLLMLFPQKMKLPALPKNDLPLMMRALEKGWLRCFMILIPYFILAGVLGSKIELTIDRDIPSMGIAIGSSLWQEETDTAGGFWERLDGAIEKYGQSYENETSEFTNYRELLEEQKELTPEKNSFLSGLAEGDRVLYAGILFFAMVGLVYLLLKKAHPAWLLSLIILGISLGCLFAPNCSGHSLLMQIFMLLSTMAVRFTFEEGQRRAGLLPEEKEQRRQEEEIEEYKLFLKAQEEERLAELRKEACANLFDMEKALREGHVIMTVSRACEKEPVFPVKEQKPEKEQKLEKEKEPEEERKPEKEQGPGPEDDFDWKFTEEELSSMADKEWAAVKALINQKMREQKN